MTSRAEQVRGIESRNERRARVMEDHVGRGRDLEAALGAGIHPAILQLVEGRLQPARRAIFLQAAEPRRHDVTEAGAFIRETSEEFANRESQAGGGAALCHAFLWHTDKGDPEDKHVTNSVLGSRL